MKTFKYCLYIVLFALLLNSCKNDKQPELKTVNTNSLPENNLDPNATYAKAEFKVKGMTCAMGCAATIEKKIAKMEGVKFAKVDFEKELAMVEYDEAKVNTKKLEKTVTSVADLYTVEDMQTVASFSN